MNHNLYNFITRILNVLLVFDKPVKKKNLVMSLCNIDAYATDFKL
jgi:hypothetical protein